MIKTKLKCYTPMEVIDDFSGLVEHKHIPKLVKVLTIEDGFAEDCDGISVVNDEVRFHSGQHRYYTCREINGQTHIEMQPLTKLTQSIHRCLRERGLANGEKIHEIIVGGSGPNPNYRVILSMAVPLNRKVMRVNPKVKRFVAEYVDNNMVVIENFTSYKLLKGYGKYLLPNPEVYKKSVDESGKTIIHVQFGLDITQDKVREFLTANNIPHDN